MVQARVVSGTECHRCTSLLWGLVVYALIYVTTVPGVAVANVVEYTVTEEPATGFLSVVIPTAPVHGHPLQHTVDEDAPFPMQKFEELDNHTQGFRQAKFLVDLQSSRNLFFVSDYSLACCEVSHPLCETSVPVRECPLEFQDGTFWLSYDRRDAAGDQWRYFRELLTIGSTCAIGGVMKLRSADPNGGFIFEKALNALAWSAPLGDFDGVLGLQPRSHIACVFAENTALSCNPITCPRARWAYHVLSMNRRRLQMVHAEHELLPAVKGSFGADTAMHFSHTYWSPTTPDKDVYFKLRGIRVCGAAMATIHGGDSINSIGYLGKVSTLTPCLEVPEEVFEGIAAWLNLTCVATPPHNYGSRLRCMLSDTSLPPQHLPPLYIQLGNITAGMASRAENGRWIRVDISAILMPDKATLCLISTGSMADVVDSVRRYVRDPIEEGRVPPVVVFGTMVMAQLAVVSSPARNVIGLVGKGGVPSLTPTCGLRARCIGSQDYDPRVNKCRDPDCAATLFKEVDFESKTCRYKLGFLVSLFVVMAALAAGELLVYRSYAKSVMPRLRALAVADRASGQSAS